MIDMAALIGPKGAPGVDVTFRMFPRRGAERWLLETRFRHPWHLETWPQANRRARTIYHVARLLGGTGAQFPSRRISLRVVKGSPYDLFRARFDALGVFLGTPGPNRKFIRERRRQVLVHQSGDQPKDLSIPGMRRQP